jgi:hypothetical protein
MSGCNCISVGCECVVLGGAGISVSGLGTSGSPFVITNTRDTLAVDDTATLDLNKDNNVVTGHAMIGPLLSASDTPTVDMTLAGQGTEAEPFVLSAEVAGIDITGGNTGDVLTKQLDGTYKPGPPVQADVGQVVVGDGLRGDGSGPDPLRVFPGTYAEWEGLTL